MEEKLANHEVDSSLTKNPLTDETTNWASLALNFLRYVVFDEGESTSQRNYGTEFTSFST